MPHYLLASRWRIYSLLHTLVASRAAEGAALSSSSAATLLRGRGLRAGLKLLLSCAALCVYTDVYWL